MSHTQLIDSCLLINRKVKEKKDQSVTLTEITQRSVTSNKMASLINDGGYTRQNNIVNPLNSNTNNFAENSPKSSHMSLLSDESLMNVHKQQTTQQSSTLTKVVCEMQHSIKNNSPIDYQTIPIGMYPQQVPVSHVRQQPYTDYSSLHQQYDPHLYSHLPDQKFNQIPDTHFKDYEPYPTSDYLMYNDRPITPSEHSVSPTPLVQHSDPKNYISSSANYDDYHRIMAATGAGASTANNQNDAINHCTNDNAVVYGYTASPYGRTNSNHLGNTIYATRASVAAAAAAAAAQYNDTLKSNNSNAMYEEDLQKHFSQLDFHKHHLIDANLHGNYATSTTGSMIGPPSIVVDDQQQQQRTMRWRDPNLTEVINFLNNPNNIIKANAAAYLQHLCYMDDPNKHKTRMLGGIPPLVKLLLHENVSVCRNACGALRNISYGRQNDENKREICNAGGLKNLISLLQNTSDAEAKELLTGVIWNMSSCEDLKKDILDDALDVLVGEIILQHSGWNYPPNLCGETCFSTIFRNASGVLRNISSAGEYARKKLRECPKLIDSLIYVLKFSIEKLNIGNKIVENACCILRNLSYRCQEIEDPNYDKNLISANVTQNRVSASINTKNDNLGCFGSGKKKKESQLHLNDNHNGEDSVDVLNISSVPNYVNNSNNNNNNNNNSNLSEPIIKTGAELLWQTEVVQLYLTLLQSCSNSETLEAAAGAIQNLAACYWQASIDVRATVRKEKGLPILVELLRMEVDRVVCAVATALRNLAIDQRNKELIGKYAMRDLVQKLPSGNSQHDHGTSDSTIAAVLATLNEVIKKNAEFSRSLLETGGIDRLLMISKNRDKYCARVIKFASHLLFTMWQHQELREVYKKHGWKEQDFVTKIISSIPSTSSNPAQLNSVSNFNPISSNLVSNNNFINSANSPNNTNNTLNRPMASQSATRYEDRTIKRAYSNQRTHNSNSPKAEEIPLADVSDPNRPYSGSCSISNYRMFPSSSASHQSLD